MAFSKKAVTLVLISIMSFAISFSAYAEKPATIKAAPDDKGNIAFTLVIENLPLTSADILEAAVKYLEEEYKTAKYTDIKVLSDKGITYGKSNLNAFYTENKIANSNVYTIDFFLRFDCKDGKVRIQLTSKDYIINSFSDIKGTETSTVEIISTPPFAEGKKSFRKVYETVEILANKILESSGKAIKSATPQPTVEDW